MIDNTAKPVTSQNDVQQEEHSGLLIHVVERELIFCSPTEHLFTDLAIDTHHVFISISPPACAFVILLVESKGRGI